MYTIGWRWKATVGPVCLASIQSITSWMDQTTQSPLLISGPCSVESPEQVLVTAQQLKAHTPISLLRGGVWKPRTKPGSFEGVGAEAMQWLIDAGRAINTPVTTEVANAQHVEIALKAGVDVLWIGARTTVNPFYVQEIAEALRGVNIPVLVKNPIHAEIGLWAGAIERFRNLGISHVAAVHRGFFSSSKSMYRNAPDWQHSFDLRALLPDIKIICDPSHIAGDRSLVSEVSQVAMDLGMDGLMIESHISPDDAWSDARQQISPEAVGRLMKELKFHTNVPIITNEELAMLREELDQLDGQIVDVLRKRMLIVKDIATIKEREGMSIFHMKRWMKLVGEHSNGSEAGLSDAFLKELFSTIHKYSVELQTSLIKKSK